MKFNSIHKSHGDFKKESDLHDLFTFFSNVLLREVYLTKKSWQIAKVITCTNFELQQYNGEIVQHIHGPIMHCKC